MCKYLIRLIIITAGCILQIVSCFSQAPEIEWQNAIGGNNVDYTFNSDKTLDGGFIIGGSSKSDISGDKTENSVDTNFLDTDYWIIKVSSSGTIEWQNTIGGGGESTADILYDIHAVPDGGFIIGGNSDADISGDKTENNHGASYTNDYWIIKLNATGDIEWQNTIGGAGSDYLTTVIPTSDNGYFVGGKSSSSMSGDKTESGFWKPDYWVLKLDSLGNIQWQNDIGGNDPDELSCSIQTSDGGYILSGSSKSGIYGDKTEANIGGYDYWIIKLNSLGNIEWQNTIGGNSDDFVSSLIQTNEGGYLVGGYSLSGITGDKNEICQGSYDYWVVKLSSAGSIEWQNTIGGSGIDNLRDIIQTADGNYLLAGLSLSGISGEKTSPTNGAADYWIIKLNNTGSIIWQKDIGGSGSDFLYSIDQSDDMGLLLEGYSYSGISGDKTEALVGGVESDIWIVKLVSECLPSPELCNTLDDNCNGLIDDGVVETISISAGGPTTFCQGGSVVLSAIYSGATVQWKKDGVNIAGATSANYTVTKKGNYTCVTTSACGSATSSIINVVVNKNPNASISAGGATTFCAGGSVTLTEIASPGCTYQWYKGASAIAGATTTNYIATTTGNYKCRVTKTATGCYKNSNAISVSVPCREDEMNSLENNSFTLFPNPANDKLNIQIESNLLSPSSFLLTITDLEGRGIYTTQLNSPTAEINISDFASGMYFVKVNFDGEEMIEKFIKN